MKLNPELTNYCNYSCIFCPQHYYRKDTPLGNKYDRPKGYMSLELWDIILDNANKYASELCLGFFGEPMLHSNFSLMTRSVPKKRKYKLVLNTNFSLYDTVNRDVLNLYDDVRISLDSNIPELYKKLCPGESFNVVDLNIRKWLGGIHAPTRLVHVVSSLNEDKVDSFVSTYRTLLGKDDSILVKSVLSYGGVVKDSYMTKNPCKILSQDWFIVGWNGVCSVCNLDVNLSMSVGNLIECRDIKKIKSSSKYLDVVKSIKSKSGICSNCFDANNWSKNKTFKGSIKPQ